LFAATGSVVVALTVAVLVTGLAVPVGTR
jgi:hypothetical protein